MEQVLYNPDLYTIILGQLMHPYDVLLTLTCKKLYRKITHTNRISSRRWVGLDIKLAFWGAIQDKYLNVVKYLYKSMDAESLIRNIDMFDGLCQVAIIFDSRETLEYLYNKGCPLGCWLTCIIKNMKPESNKKYLSCLITILDLFMRKGDICPDEDVNLIIREVDIDIFKILFDSGYFEYNPQFINLHKLVIMNNRVDLVQYILSLSKLDMSWFIMESGLPAEMRYYLSDKINILC